MRTSAEEGFKNGVKIVCLHVPTSTMLAKKTMTAYTPGNCGVPGQFTNRTSLRVQPVPSPRHLHKGAPMECERRILKPLTKDKSPGSDGLPPILLMELAEEINYPFTPQARALKLSLVGFTTGYRVSLPKGRSESKLERTTLLVLHK